MLHVGATEAHGHVYDEGKMLRTCGTGDEGRRSLLEHGDKRDDSGLHVTACHCASTTWTRPTTSSMRLYALPRNT